MTKIIAALGLALALMMTPAGAATSVTVVAAVGLEFLPGSPHFPVPLVIARGNTLQFANVDPLGWHVIESTTYDAGGEPIFGSRPIGMGDTTTVDGIEQLEPGVYTFVCWIHSGMGGSLTIV